MAELTSYPTCYSRFAYGKNITPPRTDALYHEVHDNPTASGIYEDRSFMYIFQYESFDIEHNEGYTIHRQGLYFDTSSIPDGATIISATLRFYVEYRYLQAASIIIQNGQPTFPHNPGESGDYLYSNYSGNGGEIAYADIVAGAWNTITLNDTGKEWINTAGETKIMLRVSDDINDTFTSTPSTDYAGIKARGNYSGYKPSLIIEYTAEPVVTTEAVTDIDYDYAKGNGTIVSGSDITKRGFEVRLDYGAYKDSQNGSLGDYVFHSVAGFDGTVSFDLVYQWNGVLTKTITEEGSFEAGAFTGDLAKQPYPMFNDTLFKCESYTCRAYATNDQGTGYGDYVAFDTLCDAGGEQQPTDDISEGNPTVPIIPIEPEPEIPPFEWDPEEPEPFPPWDWDLPDWEMPDYPPMSFVGDFYYRKPYTKKDLDDLRRKCIIYNKNSVEFALVLRHNMNVLREFFNMMTDYMGKEEFNDFTDLIPPQNLKELYLDPLDPADFKDMINGFIRNTIDNNMAVNRNFKLIQDGLSDYETESDDAYFKEINSNIKTVTGDDPDVHRLKSKIDSLNQEVASRQHGVKRKMNGRTL